MSCNTVQAKLSAYLDGEISGVEMQQIRQHVNACASCQEEFNTLRSVQSALRDLPATPEPPDFLVEKIHRSVAASRPSYLRLAFLVAVPALCWAIFVSTRPDHEKIQDRDLIINRQLDKDQIFDAGSDPTTGASLGHYTNLETH